MLVVTRRYNETVKIGEDIEVVVVRIEAGAVRLGIRAPKEVKLLRGELPRDEVEDDEES